MDTLRIVFPAVLRGKPTQETFGFDNPILDVICLETRSLKGMRLRKFYPVFSEKEVIDLLASNPKNPKIFARVLWLRQIREAAVLSFKG